MEKYSLWLWKKPGKLGENFFILLCGHPDAANKHLRLNTYTVIMVRSDNVMIRCSTTRELCCSHDLQEQSASAQPPC